MKKSWTERLMEGANLPDESLPRQPLVELCGDRRVLIENHGGVTEYGTQSIRVRVRYGTVCVQGSDLRLCRMLGQQLIITGNIDEIKLFRG